MPVAALKKRSVRKPSLSPTRIAAFLDCAVKYRYIYIDKIGRYYLRARPGYSFGSTMHHVLQRFHEQGEAHSAEEMAVEVDRHWISSGYESAAHEQENREAGRRMAAAYQQARQQRSALDIETVATEKGITCDLGRFKLTGRVDRIDRHPDGRLEVVDYKSGRLDTSPEEVRESLAMCCYQLILSRLSPGIPVMGTIYCLQTGNQASAMLDGAELDEFERDVVVLGDRILDTDYSQVTPSPVPACPSCDFLPRCEEFWRRQEREKRWDAVPGEHSEFGL